jgi:predicted Zn-dependent protease
VVDNQRLQSYVDQVGAKLAHQPLAEEYPYEFTLINDPSINAFALPGGPIFVNSGLVESADNEAQFAGVLAHEIAHVALRHATNQASKASLLQLPAALAGAAIGQGSVLAQVGQLGLGFGLNALMLKYSRSAETQADALGAQLMAGAGYNPLEMANFFEKLEAEGGSRAPVFLSSHPDPGSRRENVQREITGLPQRQYATNQTGFLDDAKRMVAQLPAPDSRTQSARAARGFTVPESQPARFRTLAANRFSLSYPVGWRVYGNQNAPIVTLAPERGLARNEHGGVDVAYGVIAGYYRPESDSASVQESTQEMVRHLLASNPSMSVRDRAAPVAVDGSSGQLVTLSSASPYGGTEFDVLMTMSRPEGLFYMVFIAPEQVYPQARETFNRMRESLRFR